MFELIKKYYRMGIYSDSDIDIYVKNGDITPAQGQEIKESRGQAI